MSLIFSASTFFKQQITNTPINNTMEEVLQRILQLSQTSVVEQTLKAEHRPADDDTKTKITTLRT